MTPDQATELAKRIINTMRPTPALGEWQEVLTPLDLDHALVTFRGLRDELEGGGLSIGRYLAVHRTRLAANAAREREQFAPPRVCERCDGTGWIQAPPERAHRPTVCRAQVGASSCHCTAVEPCACTRGRAAADVHTRIARANGWRPANPDRNTPLTTPSLLEEF